MRVPRISIWLLAGAILLSGQLPVRGQDDPATAEEALANEGDSVTENLRRRDSLQDRYADSVLGRWLAPWKNRRDAALGKLGLELLVSYDALAQFALGGGAAALASSGDLTIGGKWLLWGRKGGPPFELDFRVRHRHAYNGLAPSELGDQLGALWGTVDGFSNAGFEIPDLYLKQIFPHRHLELRYGQLGIENQLDRHALRGAKRSFMNQAFSTNPAVPFPRFGAGATLRWDPDHPFDFTAGITTVQASKAGDQVNWNLGSSELFSGIQGGWDFDGWRGDPARAQLLLWHADGQNEAGQDPGSGASLTLEQKLEAADARTFLRGAYAEGGAAAVKFLAAAGIGLNRRDTDLLGFSFGLGLGADAHADWQAVFECFYRWQPVSEAQITPDLQVLIGEGFRDGGSIRVIPGIRGQITF